MLIAYKNHLLILGMNFTLLDVIIVYATYDLINRE